MIDANSDAVVAVVVPFPAAGLKNMPFQAGRSGNLWKSQGCRFQVLGFLLDAVFHIDKRFYSFESLQARGTPIPVHSVFHALQVTLASGKEIETTVVPGGRVSDLRQEIAEKLDQHPRPPVERGLA